MASQSKTQLLTEIHSLLKRRYKPDAQHDKLSVLEAIIFGICHEGTTVEQANQAMSRFKEQFFDWNEVRVSSLPEIEDVLAGLPDTASRAMTIRRFLRQLFEKTYGFTLEALHKKPLKDAIRALREYEAPRSDFVLSTVIQYALGGHAIPVDNNVRRALVRLGAIEAGTNDPSVRSLLERAIPKNRGFEFSALVEALCHDVCWPEAPDCPRCDLKKICPAGQARLLALKGSARAKDKKSKVPKGAKKVVAAPAKKAKAAKPVSRKGSSSTPRPRSPKRPR